MERVAAWDSRRHLTIPTTNAHRKHFGYIHVISLPVHSAVAARRIAHTTFREPYSLPSCAAPPHRNAIRVKRVRKGVTTTLGLTAVAPFSIDRADAFAREVESTRGDLGRFAYLLVGSSAGADDLLAEAYARAWPHYKRGEIDNLPGYLRRSMANLANGRLRRLRLERREVATRRIDWRAPQMNAPESGFEHQIDTQDELWRAIWKLPADQRAVIVLRHAEDRTEEETADLLGISLGTVKSRLSRGLATLRAKLERASANGRQRVER